MNKLLYRIWSLWFYFLFLGGFILLAIPFLVLLSFNNRIFHNWAHNLNVFWGYLITYPAGVFISSVGKEKLDRNQTYVFAPNHSSFLDIPICNISIKNQFRFMGKAELENVPFFGWMFRRLHVSVKRENRSMAYKSFLKAKTKLDQGASVLVYPEGTIFDKEKVTLGRFKDGAFRLAIDNKVPIVPVTIIGAHDRMPDGNGFILYPGKVKVIFEDPISTENLGQEDVTELKNRVYTIILNRLHENGQIGSDLKKISDTVE